jgi:hypothetical protein
MQFEPSEFEIADLEARALYDALTIEHVGGRRLGHVRVAGLIGVRPATLRKWRDQRCREGTARVIHARLTELARGAH